MDFRKPPVVRAIDVGYGNTKLGAVMIEDDSKTYVEIEADRAALAVGLSPDLSADPCNSSHHLVQMLNDGRLHLEADDTYTKAVANRLLHFGLAEAAEQIRNRPFYFSLRAQAIAERVPI
jgi:hypothetical protein